MDILKALSELVRLNWRNAFALFFGGLSVLILRAKGILRDPSDLAIGYLAAFGFWILIALICERVAEWLNAISRARQAAEREEASRQSAANAERERQERAIKNIAHLDREEDELLCWIYHRYRGRARLDISSDGVRGLYNLGIIERESPSSNFSDRIYVIPERVYAALSDALGPPDPTQTDPEPPWQKYKY